MSGGQQGERDHEERVTIRDEGARQVFGWAPEDRVRIEREQRFLAEVGEVLASTIDYEATPINIAHVIVRELADVCMVETVEEGDVVRRLKVAHKNPAKAAVAHALQHVKLDRKRPHLASTVIETEEPLLLSTIPPGYLEKFAQNEEHLRILRELDPVSIMALRLIAHGRLVGVLILINTAGSRAFTEDDLRLTHEVGRRAALAIDNARLYRTSQRATQARNDVLGIVAHDLRGPLNAIVLNTQLMKRRGGLPERRSQEPVDDIRRSAMRMNRMIQDLLDVASMDAGKLAVKRERVPTAAVLRGFVESQRPLVKAAWVEIRQDVAEDTPDVWADRDRLLQILENLVANALKFTPTGGRVTLGTAPNENEVVFSVADTGAGIAAESLPHVFERFWQAKKGERLGAGLGLSIVKGLVEAHGGRIWAESTIGCGSTFYFTVPKAT